MKKLLLIGCTSKIAREFIPVARQTFDLYGTCLDTGNAPEGLKHIAPLDLSHPESVRAYLRSLGDTSFDGIIYFASTYRSDADDPLEYQLQLQTDMQINAWSAITLIKGLQYASTRATAIIFGDAGLHVPKPGFTSYSTSKAALEQASRSLAVTLKDTTNIICLRPGPVLANEDHSDKIAYSARNLIHVDNPALGLVKFMLFLLQDTSLNMTGTAINYDGGTYLIRR